MPGDAKKKKGRCLACNADFDGGIAYLSGGASLLDPSGMNDLAIPPEQHQAFLRVGFHSSSIDVSGCGDVELANDLPGGQFDLQFCTLECLKKWFLDAIEKVQSQIDESK